MGSWFLSGDADGNKRALVAPLYSQLEASCKCDQIGQAWFCDLITANDDEVTRGVMTNLQLLGAGRIDDDQQVLLVMLVTMNSSTSAGRGNSDCSDFLRTMARRVSKSGG